MMLELNKFFESVSKNKPTKEVISCRITKDYINFFNQVIDKLKELNITTILDIACGKGNLVKMCRSEGINSYGIDPIINTDPNIYQGTFSGVINNQKILENYKIDCITVINTLHGKHHNSLELEQLFKFLKSRAKYIIITHPIRLENLIEGLKLVHEFEGSHGDKSAFHKMYKII